MVFFISTIFSEEGMIPPGSFLHFFCFVCIASFQGEVLILPPPPSSFFILLPFLFVSFFVLFLFCSTWCLECRAPNEETRLSPIPFHVMSCSFIRFHFYSIPSMRLILFTSDGEFTVGTLLLLLLAYTATKFGFFFRSPVPFRTGTD